MQLTETDSPPFYFQHSSDGVYPDTKMADLARANSFVLQAGLHPFEPDNSSTEDFRGVIDDLTVENKKLKRKLRTYEKVQDSHLNNDKLFEVRVHGLSVAKKRELEETLRQFALSLDPQMAFAPANAYGTSVPRMHAHKTGSSLASASNRISDSAYISGSASAQGSSAQSGFATH